ncbi:MerR family transcriptional regulator [Flavobacterium humi]|uniref:MerR family transcriptional regulator n=1 Tax=Flavobacterium humi TaxID=2562683 RepID=A0A4Z0L4F4_9FLAO|nr:MerR family transcriptional regulator [Flavobacterium humi]
MEYVNSKEAMRMLSIKSTTTLMKYESEGKIKPTRILGSNRKRYKVVDLQKILKGY